MGGYILLVLPPFDHHWKQDSLTRFVLVCFGKISYLVKFEREKAQ